MTLCECGCGEEVKQGNRFVYGHHLKSHMWTTDRKIKLSSSHKGKQSAFRAHSHSDETKSVLSEKSKGNKNSLGHKHSEYTKNKLSEIAKQQIRRLHTDKTKTKMSEAQRGEKGSNWQGGISFEPYCHKFNYRFKEMIREKFCRECFICGKSEDENGMKLSVHHVNYDKSCLCSDIECDFVPLCNSCHSKTSNGDREYYEALILDRLGMM